METVYTHQNEHTPKEEMRERATNVSFNDMLPAKISNKSAEVYEAKKAFMMSAENIRFIENSNSLASLAALAITSANQNSAKEGLSKYRNQLMHTRIANYHQYTMRTVDQSRKSAEETRRKVVRKVARELWINFCVRGQETPMLEYLHRNLRDEFGEDLEFFYMPNAIEVLVCRNIDGEVSQVDKLEKVHIINHAWQLAQDLVDSYTLSS